jgi:hypothetical protein
MIAFAVRAVEPLQRRFIALEILGADRRFEWRCGFVLDAFRQPPDLGPSLVLTDHVANAVHHRLAKVGLQRALMT